MALVCSIFTLMAIGGGGGGDEIVCLISALVVIMKTKLRPRTRFNITDYAQHQLHVTWKTIIFMILSH